MTKNERDELKLEEQSFNKYMKDPRAFWQSVGFAILQRPAQQPTVVLNKDGEETENSKIESMTYQTLKDNLNTINEDLDGTREPTEIEMIIACQAQHARHSTPAATFIRDTMGAKPVDRQDISAKVSDYSQLTDEELEMLAEYRAKTQNNTKESPEGDAQPDIQPSIEPIVVDTPTDLSHNKVVVIDDIAKLTRPCDYGTNDRTYASNIVDGEDDDDSI